MTGAKELLLQRIHKIDVNEDLLFYYLNLKLFEPNSFFYDPTKKAALNGISIINKGSVTFLAHGNMAAAAFSY